MTPSPASSDTSRASEKTPGHDRPRRNFVLELGSLIIGGVTGLAGLVSGLIVFFDPLGRAKKAPGKYASQAASGKEGFLRLATLDSVPTNAGPRRFPVITDVRDAWNFIPGQPIGAVYVERTGTNTVRVLHATCPHAGCSVSFSVEAQQFHCPCHNSAFGLAGEKIDRPGKENPSPRPMDELEVDPEKLAQGEIWIKFENYFTGIHEKKAKT